MGYSTNPQWTPEEFERAWREQARAQGSSGMINRLPMMSRMEIEYRPPQKPPQPGERLAAYRTLRTAYHARAWR